MTDPTHGARITASVTMCLPRHLRFMSPKGYSAPRFCCACGGEVAGPEAAALVMCLYCGMEYGLAPMAEPGSEDEINALPPCFQTQWVDLEALMQDIADVG